MLCSPKFMIMGAALLGVSTVAFQPPQQLTRRAPNSAIFLSTTTEDDATGVISDQQSVTPKPYFYKRIDGIWRPRKPLCELFIGQSLFATRIPQCDYFDGATGPKVFLECGVGRMKGDKMINVNGMLRLGKLTGKKNRMKESVLRKKMAKVPEDELFKVYVSKISLDHGTFEVRLKKTEALEQGQRTPLIPASSLKPGQKLTGTIKDIHPYGVFVDVGANRKGLLHITKIADHYGRYIDKEEGFKKLRLKTGRLIDVEVVTNDRKRLELAFPSVEKNEAEETTTSTADNKASADPYDISEEEAAAWAAYSNDASDEYDNVSDEEAAMWAAYSNNSPDQYDDEEDDEPDEDREIEDALGIGSW